MGEQKLLSRIGSWFRRSSSLGDEAPSEDHDFQPPVLSGGPENDQEPRLTFLRPWAKRDQAIENLNRGLGALADLLSSIRQNMERQSERQEELLGHLAALPEALRSLPETGRAQSDALKAIQQQVERQNSQQSKLGDILERISQADSKQGHTLEALQQTVAAMSEHDAAISQNLQTLGSALQSVSQNSTAGAQVLEQLRDSASRRDGELERIIKRQNTRFTTLLTVAIVLSIAALTAVSAFGYLIYEKMTMGK